MFRRIMRPQDPAGGTPPAPPQDPPPGSPPAPPAGKTFTQAELDAIIAKRVAAAEKSTADRIKTEADTAKLDETDRLKLEKEESDRKATEARAAADVRVLAAEARVQAMALGVKPERLEHVLRLADLSAITVGDDGNVPADDVKKAVSVVLAEIPELKGTGSGSQQSGGDFGGSNGKKVWTRAEIAALAGTPEFEKHKDDINLAAREGRVRG